MDYSAAIESDPAGQSPWGSASPRAQRTPFAGAAPDSPTTPSRHATSDSQTSLPEPTIPADQAPANHGTFNGQQTQVDALPEGSSPEAAKQPAQAQIENQHAQHASQQQQAQQRPGAARYHSARQPRQVPQYKLQAKVTALERTGRKDPVLRFDVYVWALRNSIEATVNLVHRQISQSFERHNSAMSAELTLSSSSSPST